MPGIRGDHTTGLIRPTTQTRLAAFAAHLTDVRPAQIRDWLSDVGLESVALRKTVTDPRRNYDPDRRGAYIHSAIGILDCTDPAAVRRLMQVLEECLMETEVPQARHLLVEALELDGYSVDDEGNILDPASADLFGLDLGVYEDASAIAQQMGRIHKHLHTSPAEAIDATAALVAASLKLLLVSHGYALSNDDLPQLVGKAKPIVEGHYRGLGLPKDVATKMFGGMATIVTGIAELRNVESPTHPDLSEKSPDTALAEIAVSAAGSVVRVTLQSAKRTR